MDASSADALANLAAHLAGAWDAAPVLLCTCTADDVVVAGNARWRRFAGGAPGAMSRPWAGVVHADDVCVMENVAREAPGHGDVGADVRLRRSDGEYIWHTVRLAPDLDDGGVRIWHVSALPRPPASGSGERDAPLLDSSLLNDSLHVGTAMLSAATGRLRHTNRTFGEITGRSGDALCAGGVAPFVHPDEAAPLEEALGRVARGELAAYDAEHRLMRPDGETSWVRLRAAAIPRTHGTRADVALVVDDITTRKSVESALALSEERLRLATASAGIATFDYDVVADRAYWSPELYAMLGVPEGGAASQAEFLVHVHPDDRVRLLASATRTMRPDGPRTIAREFRILRHDSGEVRWLSHVASVHFADVEGEMRPVRANGVLLDVTERKAAQTRDALLLRLHETLRPLEDPIEIQEAAARVLGEHLAASRVAYGEISDDGAELHIARSFVAPGVSPVTGRFRMADYGPALVAALRAGQPIVVPDLATNAVLTVCQRAAYSQIGVGALVSVPLVKKGRLVALLAVLPAQPRAWSAADVTLVVETAERTWAAVERSRIAADLRESEARYRAMFDLSQVGKAETCRRAACCWPTARWPR